jgi:Ni2+-binding GTPase involved in maturation of urease and hydrogenase
MAKPRYVMVGGFLGAGKTTAIAQLAERFRGEGLRVGLVTNDQSVGLVDTAQLRARRFSVAEITGGCFCCRFNSLLEATRTLAESARPDVFLAEPVGSCTDLKATVSYPLRQLYGDEYAVAPLSVLVDPVRAARVLDPSPGKDFSEKVVYIYLKQLEEAEIIVINKCDQLPAAQVEQLAAALRSQFPAAKVLHVSARYGTNFDAWLAALRAGEPGSGPSMDVDYDTYAEGEAQLGWMNCTAAVSAGRPYDGSAFLKDLAFDLHRRLLAASAEVAHLKMTLAPEGGDDLAVANLVRNDGRPELSHALAEALTAGELIVNLRAEGGPEFLREATTAALEAAGRGSRARVEVRHLEAFRPGRPTPTHRLQRL